MTAEPDQEIQPPEHVWISWEGPPEWTERGLCWQVDLDLWFSDSTGQANSTRAMLARSVCKRCPVISECLEFAMGLEEGQPARYRYGVWGGLSAAQRAREDRRRRKAGRSDAA